MDLVGIFSYQHPGFFNKPLAINTLFNDFRDPAIYYWFQGTVEDIRFLRCQDNMLVATLNCQIDAKIIGSSPDITYLTPPILT